MGLRSRITFRRQAAQSCIPSVLEQITALIGHLGFVAERIR